MALTQISTAGVKDDAVTSGKIPANAVGSSELANDAVDTNAIQNDAVTNAKIGAGAISHDLIADQAVTLAKLPHGDGSSDGKFLRSNNGADPTFETVTGTTINNNGSNRIITGSGTANTLEGESTFTYDGVNQAKIDTSQTYAMFQLDGNSGGAIEFYENGTRRFEIYGIDAGIEIFDRDKGAYHSKFLSGGDFEISDGNLKFASGHGIDFGATSDASGMTSELLDDYEEGTWTPVHGSSGGSVAGGGTYNNQHGTYTKVGNRVHIACYLGWNGDWSGGGGNYAIDLPFTQNNSPATYAAGSIGFFYHSGGALSGTHESLGGYISGSKFLLYRKPTGLSTGASAGGNVSNATYAHSAGYIQFNVTMRV